MEILQKQHETKGSFYIEENGEMVAEMTYSMASGTLMIIDHTEVADSLRGKNAGFQLVKKAAAFAREKQIKIIPLCPFAKAVFEKKKDEFRDVVRQ